MAETGGGGAGAAGQPTAGGGDSTQTEAPKTNGAAGHEAPSAEVESTERDASGRFRAKLKVGGQEEDVDLSQEELIAELQRKRNYDKRWKQIEAERKQLDEQRRALQEFAQKPEAYLEELLGQERLDALLQERLAKAARMAQMTPEQVELERYKHENKRYQEQLQQQESERQKAQRDQASEALLQQAQPRIVAAMEAAGLPRVPAVIKRYAEVALAALDQGIDASEQDIARVLAEEYGTIAKHYRDLTAAKDPDKYIEWLGEEQFKKLNDHRVAKVKNGQGQRKAAPGQAAEPAKEKHEYIDEAEFRRRAGLR